MKRFVREDNSLGKRFAARAAAAVSGALQKGACILESWFFPPQCLGCKSYLHQLSTDAEPHPLSLSQCFCRACLSEGEHPIRPPYCTRCGVQLPHGHTRNHTCGACIKKPPLLEKVRAVFSYEGIIRKAIPMFKYRCALNLAPVFEARLFESFLQHFDHPEETAGVDMIIPIPLHLSKLRQRGFNQAYLLVRHFRHFYYRRRDRYRQWQINLDALNRQKRTPSQTGLTENQRRKNLKGAFCINEPEQVKGKSILLVDDVLTTGATCGEAARLLLRHGAESVSALVLART